MKTALLRQVETAILAEPKQFDISHWWEYVGAGVPNCGTTACIAGWAIAIANHENPREARDRYIEKGYWDIVEHAAGILGITPSQGERLFFIYHWPARYRRQYGKLTVEGKAKRAVRRIEHFIKTRGKE